MNKKSEYGLPLRENDIFYFDIAPVWNRHEGDAAATFMRGDNQAYIDIVKASKDIFKACFGHWETTGDFGYNLFRFAKRKGEELGYLLNYKMPTHRIDNFPHQIFCH